MGRSQTFWKQTADLGSFNGIFQQALKVLIKLQTLVVLMAPMYFKAPCRQTEDLRNISKMTLKLPRLTVC